MIPNHWRRYWQLGIAGCLAIGGVFSFPGTGAFAQVTPDPSLGTVVTPNGTTLEITGGQLLAIPIYSTVLRTLAFPTEALLISSTLLRSPTS
jgi:hypothetical protein